MELGPILVVGAAALVALALAVRAFERLGPAGRLRAWAEARGAWARGDGSRAPLVVVGRRGHRAWSVTWQDEPPTLTVAIDCATALAGEHALGDRPVQVQDAALATRWTGPAAARVDPAALDGLLDGLEALAEALEAGGPAPVDD